MDDATLVVAAREGDGEAFAAIYDRYADRLHDFCCSVLRDRAEAADAMQDTFVAAAQKLTQLRDPSKLRAWLFAIARHESLRRAKARSRAIPTDDIPDLAVSDASPENEVSRSDLTEVVWAAAAGLSERDRALLDLHLRQGLDGQELADSIGVTAGHAYVLMNRLRAQVERALGALLVARLGRDDCETLSGILSGWDGTFSVLVRKRVARHVDGCDLCSERRGHLVSPMSLLAAVPMIPAAPELRDRVLSRVELISARSPGGSEPGGGRWRSDGFPPGMIASRTTRRLVAAAAALAVAAAIGGGAFVALRDTSNGSLEVAVASPVTTSADATTDPSTTTSPASSTSRPAATTTTPAVSTTDSPTTAAPVVPPTAAPPPPTTPIVAPTSPPPTTPATSTTTAPPTTTTTTVPPDAPPTVAIVSVTNSTIYQTTGGCTPIESYFEATVADEEPIGRVRISWRSKSGSGSANMIRDNGTWYGTVGRFPDVYGAKPDAVDVTVTAWDSESQTGTDSRTITLLYAIAPYC